MQVQYKPAGYHTITPYLAVHGVARLIEFFEKAFDANVQERLSEPDGRVSHAGLRIGDSMLMLGEAPAGRAPMPCMLYFYVPDTDAAYQRALAAGATTLREPADQFYGDRNAAVVDPSGNQIWLATHLEDVPLPELQRRAAAQHTRNS